MPDAAAGENISSVVMIALTKGGPRECPCASGANAITFHEIEPWESTLAEPTRLACCRRRFRDDRVAKTLCRLYWYNPRVFKAVAHGDKLKNGLIVCTFRS